jgi:hypothetical protein
MAGALNTHGYKRVDQGIYKAFQQSVALKADGYPGKGTMTALAHALAAMGIPMPAVPIYPWYAKPGTSGYDGKNAPTWADWTALG